jgi:hypothetical protein
MRREWKVQFDEQVLAQLPAAREAGRRAAATEPRARTARYDAESGLIVLELTRGGTFSFPPEDEPQLDGFTPEELARVRVRPTGSGLSWEEPRAEIHVPWLVAGGHAAARRALSSPPGRQG